MGIESKKRGMPAARNFESKGISKAPMDPYKALKATRAEFRLLMENLRSASCGSHLNHVTEVWNQAEEKRFPPIGPYFKKDKMTLFVGQDRVRIEVLFFPESGSLKFESQMA
jgi:hypothetical protein